MTADRFTLSRHAEQRMRERGFGEVDVRYVAELPARRQIQVVLDERETPPHVITVID